MYRLTLILLLLLSGCHLGPPTTGVPASPPTITDPSEGRLIVAWSEAGNLMVWQQGDDLPRRIASGGVIQPLIAPDGACIVFTRGPAGIPESLWAVDTRGTAEQELVTAGNPRSIRAGSLIGDIAWLTDRILYFNTLAQGQPAPTPNNDLYRATVHTREVVRILPPGEGGRFSPSPDSSRIAVVSPGTYGRQDGTISVVDPLALRDPRNLLFFVGVATGGHSAFYPAVHWLPDSSALLVAIPDADLIYSETDSADSVPPTRIWQLPVDDPSERSLIGSIRASFFGLPQWSHDGTQMLYAQRTPESNAFSIMLADRSGESADAYLSAQAGTISFPRWLPDSEQFMIEMDASGNFYLGSTDTDPEPLTQEAAFAPRFVSDDLYVFVTTPAIAADGFQLRYARIGSASQPVAPAGASIPVFDARLITPDTTDTE